MRMIIISRMAIACFSILLLMPVAGVALAETVSHNISGALAKCKKVQPGDSEYENTWLLEKNLATDLTRNEILLLSELVTPQGTRICLADMILYTRYYMSGKGEYPSSALDVVRNAGLFPAIGTPELAELGSDELLDIYRFAVNPLTGDLYDKFDCRDWEAFGILLEPVSGESGVDMIPGPVSGRDPLNPEMEMQPMRKWLLRVYGETEGRVLLEGFIWSDARDSDDEWWQD